MMQPTLPFTEEESRKVIQWSAVVPFRGQLLKWIGNKQRFAQEIVSYFPLRFGTYIEPFLGSGAVLGTLAPRKAIGADIFRPLVEIWHALRHHPEQLKKWYEDRHGLMRSKSKELAYEEVRASFNRGPNGPDLLFLSRTCYGGVVRFRKADGHMSTPCGPHQPMSPAVFARRVDEWRRRCRHTEFVQADFADVMMQAKCGDLVYCDPPYVDTQAILYGAQSFSFARLLQTIAQCKARGVHVALSIDGTKRSGRKNCKLGIPEGLFETEAFVNCGRSMLRRFQMAGQTLEEEIVSDRLLLTYRVGEMQ